MRLRNNVHPYLVTRATFLVHGFLSHLKNRDAKTAPRDIIWTPIGVKKNVLDAKALKNLTRWTVLSSLFAGLMLLSSPVSAMDQSYQTPEDKILAKGFSAYMDGRNKEALTYFEEVIRINPKNDAAQKGLKKVKSRLKNKESEEKRKQRHFAETKYKEGRELMKSNDIVAAVDSYHAALDAMPTYKKAKKELEHISKDMQKVLKKKTFNLSDWAFSRGLLAYLERDWAKAYRVWSERSAIEPTNVPLANATARAESNFVKMMLSEREVFLRRSAREFYRQGLYGESKDSWGRVLEIKKEDQEALEGLARAENAILKLKGDTRDKRVNDLLEEGLQLFASQNWTGARSKFQELVRLDPEFESAKQYLVKINNHLSSQQYIPAVSEANRGWRENRPSNQTTTPVSVPTGSANLNERKNELESQLKRDPKNIRLQQELEKMKEMQDSESERTYKDGLIAYSQGNRQLAINKWKQVLVMNPDHKKAAAALRKARAEEERSSIETAE